MKSISEKVDERIEEREATKDLLDATREELKAREEQVALLKFQCHGLEAELAEIDRNIAHLQKRTEWHPEGA
jgi:chromosome segregation ATPase